MSDLIADIDKAFDYRGDVTLRLKDGRVIAGFMSNREAKGARRCPEPFVEMMLAGETDKTIIKYSEIQSVALTGEDTAAGKSWEDWMAKEEAIKKAADQV